ncbi:hypothetical protein [Bradyrhizobium sp. HKCCYLS2038]|uniref:hypothetical protein n=1 Tax=Bradyrhizobium sp. HKCCYLS2038 TaxID=3420764 RepID=UPI003EBFA065
MKADNRLALTCMAVIAVLMVLLLSAKYDDCQSRGQAEAECLRQARLHPPTWRP